MSTNIICATQSVSAGGGGTNTLYTKAGVGINQTRTGSTSGLPLQTLASTLALTDSVIRLDGGFEITRAAILPDFEIVLSVGGLIVGYLETIDLQIGTSLLCYKINVGCVGNSAAYGSINFVEGSFIGNRGRNFATATGQITTNQIELSIKTLTTTSIKNYFGTIEVLT